MRIFNQDKKPKFARTFSLLCSLFLLVSTGLASSRSLQTTTTNTINSSNSTKLGWGVILLMLLFSLSFLAILIGFCVSKPLMFIIIGLLVPVLVLVVLKVWPKEDQITVGIIETVGQTDTVYSVYDIYKSKKNYRVSSCLFLLMITA